MELKEIIAISGKPGLFRFVSQGRTAMVVESMDTGKRSSAFATDKISALEDIAIFTEEGETPLKEVLGKIMEKEGGKETISHKSSSAELLSFFSEVLPDYDTERVYTSDIKKVVQWYNQLCKLDLLSVLEEKDEAAEESSTDKDNTADPEQAKDTEKETDTEA